MPTRMLRRTASCRAIAAVAGLAFAFPVFADIYDPPSGYYTGATGTGATLKNQLHTIISTGVMVRSYDDARVALPIIDQDPDNANNIILVYTGVSIAGIWVSGGVTWNREHTWPQSLGVGSNGPDFSDLHHLRPCNPSVNSSRNNDPFGPQSANFWDPDHLSLSTPYRWRGEMARAMFYMDTRYDGSEANTVNLTLVNGSPGANQMGDLASLLEWHYSEPVSERERRRNHYVYSQAANPTYYQNNRNPFTDHPEYVWATFGTQPNNSTIYVGGSPASDGSSAVSVNLGTVIVGAGISNQNVTISKSGFTPTTFDITASGAATSSSAVARQAFTYNAQSRVISVGVSGAVAPGGFAGTLTIDNTDLTSGGAGQGVSDGNDTINVSATVLAHSNASFDAGSDQNSLTIDLGRFRAGTGLRAQPVSVHNLVAVAGYTAALDIDSISGSGDTGVTATDLVAAAGIAPGASEDASVWLDTSAPVGAYQAEYTIAVSDQDLAGAGAGPALTLTVLGEVVCAADINMDGFVSGDDFDLYVDAFYYGDALADFNNDTFVSGDDFDGFVVAFEQGC